MATRLVRGERPAGRVGGGRHGAERAEERAVRRELHGRGRRDVHEQLVLVIMHELALHGAPLQLTNRGHFRGRPPRDARWVVVDKGYR